MTVEDGAGFDDRARFDAHLALGGGLDPTWLDLFAEAVRSVTGARSPADFLDARRELDGPGDAGDRTVERVDRRWVEAVARIPDSQRRTPSRAAGSISSRRSWASCRGRRSRGSAT